MKYCYFMSENPARKPVEGTAVYPVIYKVFDIPGGAESCTINIRPLLSNHGSPCQMMIGVYNHLRNERYLGNYGKNFRIHPGRLTAGT